MEEKYLTGEYDFLTLLNANSLYQKFQDGKLDATYACYLKNVPGKFEVKNQDSIMDILMRPEVTYEEIKAFDDNTLKHAFTFAQGKLSGFDPAILGIDETRKLTAVEKKKKGNK